MINDKYLEEEDFVIQIKPHIDSKGWTGDVSLSIMVGKKNPLNDEDFEAMLNFNPKIFNKALQNALWYFEAQEEYEKCAHLHKIQKLVKEI